MSVQEVLPVPDLTDLLFTVLVFFVAIRPAWIVNVVPVLGNWGSIFVLLALLSTSSLSSLAVEVVHILIV
jgi:hypothetical protein